MERYLPNEVDDSISFREVTTPRGAGDPGRARYERVLILLSGSLGSLHRQPHLFEEGASAGVHSESPFDTGQHQPLARPCHSDVQQSSRFLNLGLAMFGRLAITGDLVVLDAHDVHP